MRPRGDFAFDEGGSDGYVVDPMTPRPTVTGPLGASCVLAMALLAGCSQSPFGVETERDLRRSVIESARRELADAQKQPAPIVTTRDDGVARLGIDQATLAELDTMAGPGANRATSLVLGIDLMGQPQRVAPVSLKLAVRSAAARNLQVQFARIAPAITESQVAAAEAAFDWTVFSNVNYNNLDSPRVATGFGGSATSSTVDQSQSVGAQVGVRRPLVSGGRLTIQHDSSYTDNSTPGLTSAPNPANQVAFTLQWDQPLLKGFGSEVTQSEIRLARNAERRDVQQLRRELIRTVTETERNYWQLVQAHRDVQILRRLLERGERVRDQLRQRERIDANQAQIADAIARVEGRRADLARAQTQLKLVSDRLKILINDPELPIGADIVLVPSDDAIDAPIKFSLLDSLRSAIQERPEVQQAILSIDDTSIRQTVARNSRLPDLNVRLQARFADLDDNAAQSYGSIFGREFVDYVVALAFEMPIGNRRAEAEYRRRRLERMQAVISYRNTLQQTLGEVMGALNRVTLNHALIAQSQVGRLAASESLRVLLIEKEITQGYTIERLNVEFQQQERLAAAERDEIQALTEYNSALADLFAAMGTTLERNGITFIVPAGDDVTFDRSPVDFKNLEKLNTR